MVVVVAKEIFANIWVVEDKICIAGVNHFTVGEDVAAVRSSEAQACVLLNNQYSDAFFSQIVNPLNDLLLVER